MSISIIHSNISCVTFYCIWCQITFKNPISSHSFKNKCEFSVVWRGLLSWFNTRPSDVSELDDISRLQQCESTGLQIVVCLWYLLFHFTHNEHFKRNWSSVWSCRGVNLSGNGARQSGKSTSGPVHWVKPGIPSKLGLVLTHCISAQNNFFSASFQKQVCSMK